MMKRFFCIISALLITITCLTPAVYAAQTADAPREIHIGTAKQFAEEARRCTLDEYSQGRTFILDRDIIFAPDEFVPFPSMGGVFDGGGHSIAGITIKSDMSSAGVFRYIERSGQVKDLNVSGRIVIGGSGRDTGGIVGVNRGNVINCTFSGTVRGTENTGGIAGTNEGYIGSCTTDGSVEGEHTAGGIAGCNTGLIVKCENKARINTEEEDISIGIDDLSEFSVTNIVSPEKLTASTDIGGIAGTSEKTIISCINRGDVGYPHSGYNIGGIAGRQSGYISGCENYGTILGRKDIGGIVGQSEPYLSLFVSAENVDELRSELKGLTKELDTTLDDVRANKNALGEKGDDLIASLDALKDMSHEYLNDMDTIVNDNVSTINELSTRVSDLITMTEPVTEKLSEAAADYKKAIDDLREAAQILSECVGETDEALNTIKPILDDLDAISDKLKLTSDDISAAISSLKGFMGTPEELRAKIDEIDTAVNNAITAFNELSTRAAELSAELDRSLENAKYDITSDAKDAASRYEQRIRELSSALSDLSRRSRELSDKLRQKHQTLKDLSDKIKNGNIDEIDWEQYKQLIGEISDLDPEGRLSAVIDRFADVVDGVSSIITDEAFSALIGMEQSIADVLATLDFERTSDPVIINSRMHLSDSVFYQNMDLIYDMVDYLDSAMKNAGDANSPAGDIISRIQAAWDFLDEGDAKLIDAVYMAVKASDNGSTGTSVLKEALSISHDINDYFSQKAELVFTGAGDEIIGKRDNIKALAGDLLTAADRLGNTGGAAVDAISADISLINSRLDRVSDIILDMVDDIKSTSTDIADYTEDISTEDSAGQSMGKTVSCMNMGKVEGDVNIGGIAGTMGVDNRLDPEGDFQIPQNLTTDFLYTEKTVIRSCTNKGLITSKRDGAGGIVGNMETGAVFSSVSYGTIGSTDGGYVGGIAGKSAAALIKNSAYCSLSGSSYIGGITGSGHDIQGCRSYAEITAGNEYTGLIAGSADGEQRDNFFVEDESGLGGIDGISYKGKATPLSYDEFILSDDTPADFRHIELLFAVTDEDGAITDTVCSYILGYGGSIPEKDIPQVPLRDGCYGKWEDFDKTDIRFSRMIRAQYDKLITTIASAGEHPVFLAEGYFDDTAELTAEQNGLEWTVTLPDDESHMIRYLSTTKRPQLIVNGENITFEKDGRYLVFEQNGSSFTLIETETTDIRLYIAIGAGAAAFMAVMIFIIVRSVKKKRDKKKRLTV